ncbi:hypothetical protein EV421DRAFT_1735884 [Armillaria borealis]|uniref:Uncharacterized protein n=1 Tax=Armillaria borealis TaxID=47425 RepID=A0AA39JJX1_9AGAR|nr:hypothetical protein EV421DRAFT_1735884 [Armillaria borealis]
MSPFQSTLILKCYQKKTGLVQAAGSVLGIKPSMIHHILHKCPCPTHEACSAAKKERAKTSGSAHATESDTESDDDSRLRKKAKIFKLVQKSMSQSELKVYRGPDIPFNEEGESAVKKQFLRATISANLPFDWTKDPEVIKLFLMMRSAAWKVMPTPEVLAGRLLNEEGKKAEKELV